MTNKPLPKGYKLHPDVDPMCLTAIEEEIARALAEYLVTDFEHGPFSDTSFARAEVESDGMVSLFASESDTAWPVASFDVPQLAEWIVHSPLLNRVRAEALREAANWMQIGIGEPYHPDEDALLRKHWHARRKYLYDRADRIEQGLT